MIADIDAKETTNDWFELTIKQLDGSTMSWIDSPGSIIYNTYHAVQRQMAEPLAQVDEVVTIGSQQIETRMVRCYHAHLCHPDYPRLTVWLHGMRPNESLCINNLPYETIKGQYISMLMALHQCSRREAQNAADCHE